MPILKSLSVAIGQRDLCVVYDRMRIRKKKLLNKTLVRKYMEPGLGETMPEVPLELVMAP